MKNNKVELSDLNVNRQFQLNLEDRELKEESVTRNLLDPNTYQPYEYTILCLKELQYI